MKGATAFNYIKSVSSSAFQELVPDATDENIQTISNVLFNDAYQPQLNEFVGNLINRIGLTIIRNKSFTNPLSMFKKGANPLGTDIQDIYENPAEPTQYELNDTAMAQLLKITDPDTHVAYYRRNRRDKYTKTIARASLQAAFISWESFENFISQITNSLYSGNYISEFEYTKGLIDGAYDNNKVIVEQVTAVTDESTAKAFVKKCRTLYSKFKFPSTDYNAYSKMSGNVKKVKTWTDEDRICLIIKSDVLAEVDVEVLAKAFNIDSTKFIGRVIEVDKFENEEILGVICDEAWLQIYDNILRFDEFYNGAVMCWNEYLHAWSTFAICPFANAVVLATATPVPVETITIANQTLTVDQSKTVTVTLAPTNSTSEIEYTSSDATKFTLTKVSNTSVTITGTGAGTAKIIALSDNSVLGEATVTVSA